MSYILDALRKADAQRERDASRGIHANAASSLGSDRPSGFNSRVGMWTAIVIGIVVAVSAGSYFAFEGKSSASMTANNAPAAQPAIVAPAKAIVPPPPAHAMPQEDMQARLQAEFNAQRKSPQQPLSQAMPRASSQTPLPPTPQVLPQSPPTEAPAVAGLPADAPRISISGGVYSPNAAQRMLIVGGQVFNEGSEIAPGLVIDKIEQRTAILKFRGARYAVAY